jgi:hypothetical protein
MGVTIDDARAIATTLPRSYEALVRDQVRFRVGRMVYAAFYDDDTVMGFGFELPELFGRVNAGAGDRAEVVALCDPDVGGDEQGGWVGVAAGAGEPLLVTGRYGMPYAASRWWNVRPGSASHNSSYRAADSRF